MIFNSMRMHSPGSNKSGRLRRGPAWFEAFLEADHFPMTTFRLFDHEKADVVEWLLDLQQQQK